MPYTINDDTVPNCKSNTQSCLTVTTDKEELIRLDLWNITEWSLDHPQTCYARVS